MGSLEKTTFSQSLMNIFRNMLAHSNRLATELLVVLSFWAFS